MQKPLILTVDDDTEVLRAIERDLKKHYRALRAESGRAALDLLRRLQQRNDAVALLCALRFVIAPPADTAGAVNKVAIQLAEALIAV
jgi:CheY-like chemotaxis protein